MDVYKIVKEIKLKEFTNFGDKYDLVACFDENGSPKSQSVIKKCIDEGKPIDENIRYFTLTCCLFNQDEYIFSKEIIQKLKSQYFKKASEPVVLHTRDIKKKNPPFNFGEDRKYTKFIQSLSTVIDMIKCRIISVTFDLYSYIEQNYTYDPYKVAFDIILKVISENISPKQRVALVFEGRGKKEDKELYYHIYYILNKSGAKDIPLEQLRRNFDEAYFNRKISSTGEFAYPGIEMADLCSYPIHRFMRYGREAEDYLTVKKKLIGYKEGRIRIYGLRKFPAKWQK